MVGIVSGNGLGLFNSSQDVLGLVLGQSGFGQAKGASHVNIATGNLSIQFLDESLSGSGADLFALRTYNSLGSLSDGDADGWRWAGERRVALSGTVNTAGSTVTRTLGDGGQTVFNWNGSQYVSFDSSGAHDTLVWNAGGNEWVFTQDGMGVVERYNGSTGWIKNSRDGSGAGFDYVFAGDKLTSIKDVGSGQTFEFVYGTNGKLGRLDSRTTATGALTRQVYYEYDTYGRLQFVKTDLSPSDSSIADNSFYQTKYSYSGTTNRITRVDQSDGTFVGFVYDSVTGKIKNVMDQSGVSTFTYNSGNTTVANTAGELWTYNYDGSGRLTS